jgi:hypothetical protein
VKPAALLRHTVAELRLTVEQPSPYRLIKAAGLVRLCLLDRQPLALSVNRDRGVPLRFEIPVVDEYTRLVWAREPAVWAWADGFSPRLTLRSRQYDEVPLPDFLRHPALWVSDHLVPVRAVVRQIAHVEGGVHAGTPKEELDHVLTDLNRKLQIGDPDTGFGVRLMRGISDVVVHALEPITGA